MGAAAAADITMMSHGCCDLSVQCSDVARGIANAVLDPSVYGQTYEFYG